MYTCDLPQKDWFSFAFFASSLVSMKYYRKLYSYDMINFFNKNAIETWKQKQKNTNVFISFPSVLKLSLSLTHTHAHNVKAYIKATNTKPHICFRDHCFFWISSTLFTTNTNIKYFVVHRFLTINHLYLKLPVQQSAPQYKLQILFLKIYEKPLLLTSANKHIDPILTP